MVASVITLPLIVVPPIILGVAGTVKCKFTDATIMKLSPKGTLSFDNASACTDSKFMRGSSYITDANSRSFYSLDNLDSKNSYIIADDLKNIVIYNVNQKKAVRTISHKAGNLRTTIAPAKDGHFMVIEYNKIEKYTSLSIEALN